MPRQYFAICVTFSKVCHVEASAGSSLTTAFGWNVERGWKKFHDKIPAHEKSKTRAEFYMRRRVLQTNLSQNFGIHYLIDHDMQRRASKWVAILEGVLNLVLFLAKMGLEEF